MPTIAIHETEPIYGGRAYELALNPPIKDRLAEMICRQTVDPFMMVIEHGREVTRLYVESAQMDPDDIEAVAHRVGARAYSGDAVRIESI